jgi:hypothetical protein
MDKFYDVELYKEEESIAPTSVAMAQVATKSKKPPLMNSHRQSPSSSLTRLTNKLSSYGKVRKIQCRNRGT